MIRRPPISTPLYSSATSDVYKRQVREVAFLAVSFKQHLPLGAPALPDAVDSVKGFYTAVIQSGGGVNEHVVYATIGVSLRKIEGMTVAGILRQAMTGKHRGDILPKILSLLNSGQTNQLADAYSVLNTRQWFAGQGQTGRGGFCLGPADMGSVTAVWGKAVIGTMVGDEPGTRRTAPARGLDISWIQAQGVYQSFGERSQHLALSLLELLCRQAECLHRLQAPGGVIPVSYTHLTLPTNREV